METRFDPGNLKKSFSRMRFNGFDYSKSRDFTGGIAMGWKADKLKVKIMNQFIHCRIVTEDGKTWYLSVVYASHLEDRKKYLWKELTEIATTMNTG